MNQQIRIRTFIKNHIDQRGDELLDDLTPTFVIHWWRLLNVAVFDRIIQEPKKIHCRNFRDGTYGWCQVWVGYKITVLGIRRVMDDRRTFLTVLAHEMSHQAQWTLHEEVNHKNTFFYWREPIKEYTCLPLNRQVYTP